MKALAFGMALALSLPAAAQDKTRAEYESRLKNIKVTLDFTNAPLDVVMDYLREISGLNLFVGSKVADKQILVTLKVNEITLKSVFSLILKPHGCDTLFREGVLMILPQEEVADRTIKLELYDCRDILYPVMDFPGVDIQLAVDGGLSAIPSDVAASAEFPIEELIRAHTGGRSWEENSKTSLKLQNGILVVKNTPEVHRQVIRLLDLLRSNK